jgi:undecaprenyl pyrophosphate phosphatase UppP
MKQFITKLLKWFAGSADNMPNGASSKKLSAFWALVILATIPLITWTVWAYKNDNWGHLEYVLTSALVFCATALGINSNEKIKGKANITDENKPA